jgi:hypothetical protein
VGAVAVGVEEVEIRAERLGRLDVGGARPRIAFITFAPVRQAASTQNEGPSSPWNWRRVRFSRSAASITSSRVELTNRRRSRSGA